MRPNFVYAAGLAFQLKLDYPPPSRTVPYTKRAPQKCGDKGWRNNTRERESDALPVELPCREGTARTRTGNLQIKCSSSGIRRRRFVLATSMDESFQTFRLGTGVEPALPCTPTGIRQLLFKRADKEIGETLNMFGM